MVIAELELAVAEMAAAVAYAVMAKLLRVVVELMAEK
jgi:hypothetical protein